MSGCDAVEDWRGRAIVGTVDDEVMPGPHRIRGDYLKAERSNLRVMFATSQCSRRVASVSEKSISLPPASLRRIGPVGSAELRIF